MISGIIQIVLLAIVFYTGLILIPQICENIAKAKEERESITRQNIICPHMLQFT